MLLAISQIFGMLAVFMDSYMSDLLEIIVPDDSSVSVGVGTPARILDLIAAGI